MRYFYLIIFCSCFLCGLGKKKKPLTKVDFEIFNQKTTYVVLKNSSFEEMAMSEAIKKNWKLTSYEFCDWDRFERIAQDSNFHFLFLANGKFSKEDEPSILYLNLVRGGSEAKSSIFDMRNIIYIPVQSIDQKVSKTLNFFDIYIKLIQNYILKRNSSLIKTAFGLEYFDNNLNLLKDRNLLIEKSEINVSVNEDKLNSFTNIKFCDEDKIEETLSKKEPNKAVSIIIRPRNDKGFSFKMLFTTDTEELIYYKKTKSSNPKSIGFTLEELSKFAKKITN